MTQFTDLQGLAVGQVWEHKNGNIYEIYDFTNLEAGRQDEYPTTVSYRNIHTGAPYSRAVVRWAGSFTRREDLEEGDKRLFQVTLNLVDAQGHLVVFQDDVVATGPRKAIDWGKEQVAFRYPGATISYVNVTGGTVAELKLV